MNLFRRFGLAALVAALTFTAFAPHPVHERIATVALNSIAAPAEAAATSNYLQNQTLDFLFRNQSINVNSKSASFSAQTTDYVELATSTSTAQACGTEVSAGGYGRVGVASALSAWSGTQGSGTTTASSNSSGSSGTISNNNPVTFGAPTANWGTITSFCMIDSSSGGNLLIYAPLTTPKTVNNGDAAPSFAAGALQITLGKIVDPHLFVVANDDLYQAAA